jgi:hypothetical protein
MKVRSLAGRTFPQRIFYDPLCHLKDPAIFALIFVNRHLVFRSLSAPEPRYLLTV